MIQLTCSVCSNAYTKSAGHYNRAVKLGAPVYCGKECAGLARRKTLEEKKAIKAEYDKKRHIEGGNELLAQKRKHYHDNKERYREKQKEFRSSPERKAYHAAYINSDRYKEWKKNYDKKNQAKKNYGEFWESFIILEEIDTHLDKRVLRQDSIYGYIINKSQNRKRTWHKNSQPKI